MKRNDIQFGTNRAGTQSHPHQIITSSHNPSPAIQYVLKNDNNAQPQNIQFAGEFIYLIYSISCSNSNQSFYL
jgi:hypothetical protein